MGCGGVQAALPDLATFPSESVEPMARDPKKAVAPGAIPQ